TPKAKQRLPDVMSAEKTNNLLDAVELGQTIEKPSKERDIAILELLYGCGIRVSELVGINLEDIDLRDGWLRVRGKGNKERQVPYFTHAHVRARPAEGSSGPLLQKASYGLDDSTSYLTVTVLSGCSRISRR